MRPKKTAAEQKILLEKLFDELVAARHKLPPRRIRILANAHELHPHLVGGYNFMTDVISRPSERAKKNQGKRAEAEDATHGSGSETDPSERDSKDVKKKRSKKQKSHHGHRKRAWVPLWEGELTEVGSYLAKAVNMAEADVEILLKEAKDKSKDKKPTIRCSKWKTLGCCFKCQVTISGVGAAVTSLGVHKHEGKVAVVEPIPEEAVLQSLPVAEGSAFVPEDVSPRGRLKDSRTEDLEVPISSPSLLPLPSAEEDNRAALQALAAWKPPQALSEDDENESDDPRISQEEDNERKASEERSLEREERQIERVEREEMMDSEEEESVEPRVDDHAMFTGFEPGFLETEESTTYHAIGTIGDDGRTGGSEDEEEGDEEEGDV